MAAPLLTGKAFFTTTTRAMARSALEETSKTGAFVRTDSVFRDWVRADPDAKFPASKGRYELIISYACPWANGCLVMRNVKGLQDTIALSVVHPTWQRTRPDSETDPHSGWTFATPGDPPFKHPSGASEFACDKLLRPFRGKHGKTFVNVREIYEEVTGTVKEGGKYTVPILFDHATSTIVNNESMDIQKMLNGEFNEFAKHPDLDLCPSELEAEVEKLNTWIYPNINNGVYRCGFARSQQAYDEAVVQLSEALHRADDLLSTRRYTAGDRLTVLDIRLFMTLVRFDEVYVVYFKTNSKPIKDFPNLRNYCRDIYQVPGLAECISMTHIKVHYFSSHPLLNAFGIIPRGPEVEVDLQLPHNRNEAKRRRSQ